MAGFVGCHVFAWSSGSIKFSGLGGADVLIGVRELKKYRRGCEASDVSHGIEWSDLLPVGGEISRLFCEEKPIDEVRHSRHENIGLGSSVHAAREHAIHRTKIVTDEGGALRINVGLTEQ